MSKLHPFWYFVAPEWITENFTTWTEVDPNNKLSQTSARATWTDMIRKEACYLYKAIVTPSEFTHKFDFQLSSIDVNASTGSQGLAFIWVVCESSGRPRFSAEIGKNIALNIYEIGGGTSLTTYRVYLFNTDAVVIDYSSVLDVGVTYYFTITKVGAVVTCTIYSDAERTTVVDTLTIDLTGQDEEDMSFSYMETTASFDDTPDDDDQTDGYIENLKRAVT